VGAWRAAARPATRLLSHNLSGQAAARPVSFLARYALRRALVAGGGFVESEVYGLKNVEINYLHLSRGTLG